MLAKNLDDLYFSQSALIAYQNCPLKFRRRYLDGLFWPLDWGGNIEQKDAVEQGRLFHLLAERYYLHGEKPATAEFAEWFTRLMEFRPYHENGLFLPEHELRINDQGIKLVAKYDLVYFTSQGRAIIYDWKTNNSRPLYNYWRKHLQTITYRYLLCRTGGVYTKKGFLQAEDISMICWNPRYPKEIQPISYSQKEFQQDEQILNKLIREIKSLSYDRFLATGDQKRCKFCEYSPICHGKRAVQLELEEEEMNFDLDWDAIEEIQF